MECLYVQNVLYSKRNGKMRRLKIYIFVYQIALHPAMTVIPFLAACPRIRLQAPYPFGIFPFLMISSVPDTSAIILMKNATSILPFII